MDYRPSALSVVILVALFFGLIFGLYKLQPSGWFTKSFEVKYVISETARPDENEKWLTLGVTDKNIKTVAFWQSQKEAYDLVIFFDQATAQKFVDVSKYGPKVFLGTFIKGKLRVVSPLGNVTPENATEMRLTVGKGKIEAQDFASQFWSKPLQNLVLENGQATLK